MSNTKKIKRTGPNTKRKIEENRKKVSKFFSSMIIVAAVVAGIAFVYSETFPVVCEKVTPYIAIDGYDIKGGDNLDSVLIEKCVNLYEKSNYFNTSTNIIEENIKKIEGVENAKVNKRLLSQALEIKITQRTAKYLLNIDNELYLADKYGYLWINDNVTGLENLCFVVGLETTEDEYGKKITPFDLERLEKTYSSINGGVNPNNVKSIHFKNYGVIEFTASNISVPIRLNGTLKYTAVDFVKFEDILRQNKKAPMYYLDAYENVVYAK